MIIKYIPLQQGMGAGTRQFRRKRRKDNNNSSFIPFKYQGQYEDVETGLYYNRFHYYDSCAGNYISQNPIWLSGEIIYILMYKI